MQVTQVRAYVYRFPPELRDRLDRFLDAEKARGGPYKLEIRSIITDALTEWLDKREGDQRAA
jgi:predicted DNA-binding protein